MTIAQIWHHYMDWDDSGKAKPTKEKAIALARAQERLGQKQRWERNMMQKAFGKL